MATFLPPLSHEKLLTWWKERIAEVNDGKRRIWILVTDIDATGKLKGPEVMGVVMLSTPYSETGAFRGYVEKLLVHKNCRGKGGARALMEALEAGASSLGRNLLARKSASRATSANDSVVEIPSQSFYKMRSAVLVVGMAASAEIASAGLYPGITPDNHTCALVEPVLSCSCKARPEKVKDTCCTETYGGLLVATQLWSTFTGLESKGQMYAKDSWSIHGLWPGSYTQYCDLSRQYDPEPAPNTTDSKPEGTPVPPYRGEPIDRWFEPYGKLDLLAYMSRYWVSQYDANWVFWAHEFSKHATCFSTFQKECYGPKASQHEDLFDFFETVIRWQRRLPTFRWLADAGIRPSNNTAYAYADVQGALTRGFGSSVFVGCGGPRFNETEAGRGSADNGRTELNEIWYYYHVRGTPRGADGNKLDAGTAGGRLTTCAEAKEAVKYYERSEGSEE
ncbi:hypothetical protein EsDP_00001154 [Epichloe bromicola]|uniref:ribonuclease T2 n=1 Tax=Epichloe bromicola TaxID=79588 RepID=A0ABQ0CH10_9HYPO